MKLSKLFLFVFISFVVFGLQSITLAQSSPVLYFCEEYTSSGEVGISDIFTTGYITIMVKSDNEIGLTDCHIEYDKLDSTKNKFDYYKMFDFIVDPKTNFLSFSKTTYNDLTFEEPGIYRVLLLDNNDKPVASSLVQIVSK